MSADRPHVRVDPAQRFGQPNVKGISVEAIGDAVLGEKDVDVVADEYSLTRGEVLVACWHLGTYGTRRWRRLWGTWADDVYDQLAASTVDYATVPDPPLDT